MFSIEPGDIVSYLEMCSLFNASLQRGMNFHLRPAESLVLMSLRPGAPYADRIEEGGRVIIYEGHDVPRRDGGPDPKSIDQQEFSGTGKLTQNGLFVDAVRRYKLGRDPAENVRVFEKIKDGIWSYNGLFRLVDVWRETSERRQVFKFKFVVSEERAGVAETTISIDHNRVIPAAVKQEVWKRDKGGCVKCGAKENLHFDHIIPYSEGGSSKDAKNIQILCLRHNLQKHNNIE